LKNKIENKNIKKIQLKENIYIIELKKKKKSRGSSFNVHMNKEGVGFTQIILVELVKCSCQICVLVTIILTSKIITFYVLFKIIIR